MPSVIDAVLRLKDEFTPVLNTVQGKLNETKAQGDALSQRIQEHEKVNARAAKQWKQTGNSIKGVGDTILKYSAPIVTAMGVGLKATSAFATGMAKLSTAVKLTAEQQAKLKQSFIETSDATGVAVEDTTELAYHWASAGVQADDLGKGVDAACKLSVIGFTDANSASQLLIGTMNSLGMTVNDLDDITATYVKMQQVGNLTIGELSGQIEKVLPAAHSLGASLHELGATYDFLANKGLSIEVTTSGLRNIMGGLEKPTKEMQTAAEMAGVSLDMAHIQAEGWVGFLDEVVQKTGGDAQQMMQILGGGKNGIAIANALATDGAIEQLKNLDKQIQNTGGVSEETMQQLMKNNPALALKLANNQLRNSWMELAQGMAPFIASASMKIKTLAKVIHDLTPEQRKLITSILQTVVVMGVGLSVLGRVVSAVGTVRSSINGLAKAFLAVRKAKQAFDGVGAFLTVAAKIESGVVKIRHAFTTLGTLALRAGRVVGNVIRVMGSGIAKLGPVILRCGRIAVTAITTVGRAIIMNPIGAALTALVVIIVLVATHWEQFKQITLSVWNAVKSAVNSAIEFISGIIQAGISYISEKIASLREFLQGIIDYIGNTFSEAWSAAWNSIKDVFGNIWEGIKSKAANVLDSIAGFVQRIIDKAHSAKSAVQEAGNGNGPDGNWTGATWYHGGLTYVNEAGPELIKLPTGAQIVPHSESLKEEYRRGVEIGSQQNASSLSITIPKLADSIVVREEQDIDDIAERLVFKIKQYGINQMKGALI